MRISKKICIVLLLFSLFIPSQLRLVHAAGDAHPDYVGVDENDAFVWKIRFDEGPYEDYLEDTEVFTEAEIEDMVDSMFSGSWDEDVEGWKIVILDIEGEKEITRENVTADVVYFMMNWYITDDFDNQEWEEEFMNERGGIPRYDKDFYGWMANSILGLFNMMVANNIKWDKVVIEANEELDDEYGGDDEKGSASVVKSRYEEVGISIVINEDEEKHDDFEALSKFNDDGVLMYYEWSYDGEPIIELELEGQFFHENWEVIVIGAQILGVLAIVIIVIKKKEKIKPNRL